MTKREEIRALRAEVRRLKAALTALIGGADDELGGYDAGWADGAAGKPLATLDPATTAAVGRIAAKLTGTEPSRHLRPV